MDLTNFEWPVAERYEIISAEEPPASSGGTILSSKPGPKLRAIGALVWKCPFATGPDGQLTHFEVQGTVMPERILAFASRYGMLTTNKPGATEPLSVWTEAESSLRAGHAYGERLRDNPSLLQGSRTVLHLDLRLELRDGHLELAPRPRNLLGALNLELLQGIVGRRGSVQPCLECGKPFELGGRARRQVNAKYCSNNCRHKYNNRRKSEAIKITRDQ